MRMISAMDQTKPADFKASLNNVKQYVGEVVYIYAFDVAYDMARQPIRELLGQPVAQFAVDASKRSPRHLFFYKPQMVRLPPLERIGPHGPVRIERAVKILPVGAISITVRVPFAVRRIEDLVDYHDLEFSNGVLQDEVRRLADEVRQELKPHFIRPVEHLAEEEAYTVFCIQSPLATVDGIPLSAENWLRAQRREVALIVDRPENFDETLYVMELANLQLAELEAYDRILDHALERSYRDLSERRARARSDVLRELRDIRIDLARFNDELSNITKFFGDWHLARIYENISARFHLGDWHRSINGKLKTLDDLYQLLKYDQNNRWMLILELTIVLLFVIDLVIVFLGLKK